MTLDNRVTFNRLVRLGEQRNKKAKKSLFDRSTLENPAASIADSVLAVYNESDNTLFDFVKYGYALVGATNLWAQRVDELGSNLVDLNKELNGQKVDEDVIDNLDICLREFEREAEKLNAVTSSFSFEPITPPQTPTQPQVFPELIDYTISPTEEQHYKETKTQPWQLLPEEKDLENADDDEEGPAIPSSILDSGMADWLPASKLAHPPSTESPFAAAPVLPRNNTSQQAELIDTVPSLDLDFGGGGSDNDIQEDSMQQRSDDRMEIDSQPAEREANDNSSNARNNNSQASVDNEDGNFIGTVNEVRNVSPDTMDVDRQDDDPALFIDLEQDFGATPPASELNLEHLPDSADNSLSPQQQRHSADYGETNNFGDFSNYGDGNNHGDASDSRDANNNRDASNSGDANNNRDASNHGDAINHGDASDSGEAINHGDADNNGDASNSQHLDVDLANLVEENIEENIEDNEPAQEGGDIFELDPSDEESNLRVDDAPWPSSGLSVRRSYATGRNSRSQNDLNVRDSNPRPRQLELLLERMNLADQVRHLPDELKETGQMFGTDFGESKNDKVFQQIQSISLSDSSDSEDETGPQQQENSSDTDEDLDANAQRPTLYVDVMKCPPRDHSSRLFCSPLSPQGHLPIFSLQKFKRRAADLFKLPPDVVSEQQELLMKFQKMTFPSLVGGASSPSASDMINEENEAQEDEAQEDEVESLILQADDSPLKLSEPERDTNSPHARTHSSPLFLTSFDINDSLAPYTTQLQNSLRNLDELYGVDEDHSELNDRHDADDDDFGGNDLSPLRSVDAGVATQGSPVEMNDVDLSAAGNGTDSLAGSQASDELNPILDLEGVDFLSDSFDDLSHRDTMHSRFDHLRGNESTAVFGESILAVPPAAGRPTASSEDSRLAILNLESSPTRVLAAEAADNATEEGDNSGNTAGNAADNGSPSESESDDGDDEDDVDNVKSSPLNLSDYESANEDDDHFFHDDRDMSDEEHTANAVDPGKDLREVLSRLIDIGEQMTLNDLIEAPKYQVYFSGWCTRDYIYGACILGNDGFICIDQEPCEFGRSLNPVVITRLS